MKYYLIYFLTTLLCVHSAYLCGSDCLECNSNSRKCFQCKKGFYSQDGKCVDRCSTELYADNYSMTCKKMKDNPVYIKAYTSSRCINSCGKDFSDCSCSQDCRLKGNCCSDFRFCEIVWEKDSPHVKESSSPKCLLSTKDGKVCLQCKDNFFYYKNQCLDQCPHGTITQEENKICIEAEESKFINFNSYLI